MSVTSLSFYKSLLPCQIDTCIGKTVLFCIHLINQYHWTIPSLGSLLDLELSNIKELGLKNLLGNSVCLFKRVKRREKLSQRESSPYSDSLSYEPGGAAMPAKVHSARGYVLWHQGDLPSLTLRQIFLQSVISKLYFLEEHNEYFVQRNGQWTNFNKN